MCLDAACIRDRESDADVPSTEELFGQAFGIARLAHFIPAKSIKGLTLLPTARAISTTTRLRFLHSRGLQFQFTHLLVLLLPLIALNSHVDNLREIVSKPN